MDQFPRRQRETISSSSQRKTFGRLKLPTNPPIIGVSKTIDQQLYEACANGETGEVRKLLAHPTVYPNSAHESGQTSLYIACGNGQIEVVRLLLNDVRVDVNRVNINGQTPFYIACEIGYVELVKLLLNDERVDFNKMDNNGQKPFLIACRNKNIEIVKLLLNESEETTKDFFLACGNNTIESVQYILASGREINLNEKDDEGNTVIDLARRKIGPIEQSMRYHSRSHQALTEIVELLESFERNPTDTRTRLRNQLGLPDINFFDGNKRERRRKNDEEKKMALEERKNQAPKEPEYEIEFNNELFILQMVVKSLPEFEIAIKSTLQLEQSEKIRLSFKRKGKLIVLDNMRHLKEGMTVKVSLISQFQPNPRNQVEHFQLKNWNEVVFLSQGASDEYRIEIDPDEIPPQIKNQIVQLMQKSSKLETCLRSRLTPSNVVFQIDFVSRNRADKVFEQLVDLLESN